MEIIKNKSIFNLHSIYSTIGKSSNLCSYTQNNNFFSISSYESIWPNAIFNLQNEFNVDEVVEGINTQKFSSLILKYDNDFNVVELKNKGFYLIEQWTLMQLLLKKKSLNITNEILDVESCKAENEVEILSWIKAVETNLFSNKKLSPKIVYHLLQNKAELYYIKFNNEIVATTLVYIDENNIAGIYMVSTNKIQRGKGFGSTIINFALSKIMEKNIETVVLQSTKLGYSLYKKLNFIDTGVCNLIYKLK